MNERIKQLMDEAVRFRLDPDSKQYEAQVSPEDLEVFAELIVQECGQWWTNRLVVEPDYGLPHRIERNRAVPGVIKEFKEHFGVEE